MTWAEFNLRLISYNRQEEENLKKLRRVAWSAFIAPHQNPKKLRGMKEDSFWQIGAKKKKGASKEIKELFLKRYKEYLEKTKHGRT